MALTFGLLHGFGFAGALAEVGLPETAIPLALFLFNVGVEMGQVFFVVAVLGFVWTSWRLAVPWPGLARTDIRYRCNRGVLDNSAGGEFLVIEAAKPAAARSFKNSINRGGARHLNFNLGALQWLGLNR